MVRLLPTSSLISWQLPSSSLCFCQVQILSPESLGVLTTKSLEVLSPESLRVLTTKSLEVLSPESLGGPEYQVPGH